MGSDNPFAYGSASWSKLGADSPFKGATGIGKTDWGSMGSSDYWKGGFDVDKKGSFGSGPSPFDGRRLEAFGKANSWLERTREKADQDEAWSKLPYALGRGSQGFGGQVLDNLGVVMPNQHAPIVIPGVQQSGGGGGLFGAAGGLAGALGQAAGVFGPLGMPIGAAVGGMIDRFV